MKKYKYIIWYSDGIGLLQYADTMYQAVIVSLAKRINDAKDFSIDSIEDEKGNHYEISQYMEFNKIDYINKDC